jgi:phosphoglycerol transferase MdoB-like AlkP superfamily enzyme
MPCLILILFVAFPRIALLLIFFLSNYLQRADHGLLIPLIGFIFLPLTTLAYAWMVNSGLPIAGLNLVILIICVIVDIGGLGGGEYHRRNR